MIERLPRGHGRYCSYFTRHMPVELRERLHAIVQWRNDLEGRRVWTLEDVVNEAIEIGLRHLEGQEDG